MKNERDENIKQDERRVGIEKSVAVCWVEGSNKVFS